MALFNKKKKEEKPQKDTGEEIPKTETQLSVAPILPKGGDSHSYRVILSPHVTEKGSLLGEQNQYVFKVAGSVNKLQVKVAVENLYKVEVAKVRVSYLPSKYRRVGRFEGAKSGFKKAVVTLKEGGKIDLAN